MKLYEIWFKSSLDIEDLAKIISDVLKVADVQRRHGINLGGLYYQFEVFGFTMELLFNAGEVKIPERSDWSYYMPVYTDEVSLSQEDLSVVIKYVAAVLRHHGLETDVDALSV